MDARRECQPMRSRSRRFRVMAEYGSSGIWAFSDGTTGAFRHGMVEHVALGLPFELSQRFAAWIATYEDHRLADTLDVDAFNAEGLALANRLKAHLGSDIHVEFQGEAADGSLLVAIAI